MTKRRTRSADDVPELGRDWFAGATKIADGPDAMRAYVQAERRRRGKQKTATKRLVSLRLSPDVLETYKGTGRGWQTRIDEDLKKAAKRIRAAS
jgi:uncharacterized protein (DUF4415 family)